MPLTSKGHSILHALEGEYGNKAGERVFYAGKNKGVFTGVDFSPDAPKVVEGNAACMDNSAVKETSPGGNAGAVISPAPKLGLSAYQDSEGKY
jgi:hypothetical protein